MSTSNREIAASNREIAALPSGHVGIYRADDGKGWEAYVMPGRALVLLGVYASKRAAVAARAKYWKAKDRATVQHGKRNG
jgi:hypothetical protein